MKPSPPVITAVATLLTIVLSTYGALADEQQTIGSLLKQGSRSRVFTGTVFLAKGDYLYSRKAMVPSFVLGNLTLLNRFQDVAH